MIPRRIGVVEVGLLRVDVDGHLVHIAHRRPLLVEGHVFLPGAVHRRIDAVLVDQRVQAMRTLKRGRIQ